MNYQDQEDLDTWLLEVELAQKEIKDLASGKVKVEEFDKKEKLRQEKKEDDKLKKEEEEKRIRFEKYEQLKQGHAGKGQHKTYLSFCRYCFWEYELPTPECLRCKKNTISYEKRMEELTLKVGEYKTSKTKREERKKKWELWKKTQAMLWKKTSTNYSKWDNYTSESDSETEEADPVLPKNDPNFQALEMDIEQRKKKRANDKLIAESFKIKGNEAMAKEDYKEAVKMYSSGLDAMKDIKALWTNRALAYIKLKKYGKAIEDCTRVLEYCECFEEGYTQSRDSAFKAFLRRSYAKKEKKEYKLALEDVEEALKLYPKEKQALDLKDEIFFIVKHKEQASKLILNNNPKVEVLNQSSPSENADNVDIQNDHDNTHQENDRDNIQNQEDQSNQENANENNNIEQTTNMTNTESVDHQEVKCENKDEVQKDRKGKEERTKCYMKCIDYFMEKKPCDIDEEDMKELIDHLAKTFEAKIYFFEKKGTARLENLFKEKKQCYLLANVLIDDNILYQDQFLKNECHLLIQSRISELLAVQENGQPINYSEIEDAFEVLNTLSTMEKSRTKLASLDQTIKFIQLSWDPLLKVFQSEPLATSNYLVFVSNLCFGNTLAKKNLIPHLTTILNDLHKKRRGHIEKLRENSYNLLANLMTDETVRKEFSKDKYTQILEVVVMRLTQYDLIQNPKQIQSAEAALAVLVNASYQGSDGMQAILKRLSVDLIIIGRFFKLSWKKVEYFEIFNRSLQILAKLDYSQTKLAEKLFELQDMFQNDKFASHLIRLYANICTNEQVIPLLKNNSKIDFNSLVKTLKIFIQQDEETKFCNSCNLAAYINDFLPQFIPEYRDMVPRLISVCRDKTGNLRKNAAIFLAKLAKNSENLELIRKLHGIEILHSITAQVIKK